VIAISVAQFKQVLLSGKILDKKRDGFRPKAVGRGAALGGGDAAIAATRSLGSYGKSGPGVVVGRTWIRACDRLKNDLSKNSRRAIDSGVSKNGKYSLKPGP
jgi:hypothetical protein